MKGDPVIKEIKRISKPGEEFIQEQQVFQKL